MGFFVYSPTHILGLFFVDLKMVNSITPLLLFFSFINAQIALPTFQGVHIQHSSCASTSTLEVRISHNNDDAEERENNQGMYLTSTDLELVYNGGRGRQHVGMRFLNITIPQGTVIKNTYIRFTVDETTSSDVTVTFYGEDIDDAVTFSNTTANISSRTKTSASVNWSPNPWTSVGATHDSPDLTSITQEIVNRSGWDSGNDMVFIVTGTQTTYRTAESHNGSSSQAPLLHIEYCTP